MWVLKGKGWLAGLGGRSRMKEDERDPRNSDLLRDYGSERGARALRADILGVAALEGWTEC